jgi:hypothetical protein
VAKLKKSSPKNRHQAPILFISSFSKATYKYFNYFGPWTADVQGPLLNSCVMNVIKTVVRARPVKNRAVITGGAGVLACGLWRRPAATRMKPKALLAQSQALRDQIHPCGPNLKFRELFRHHPARPGVFYDFYAHFCKSPRPLADFAIKNSQPVAVQIFNKITN